MSKSATDTQSRTAKRKEAKRIQLVVDKLRGEANCDTCQFLFFRDHEEINAIATRAYCAKNLNPALQDEGQVLTYRQYEQLHTWAPLVGQRCTYYRERKDRHVPGLSTKAKAEHFKNFPWQELSNAARTAVFKFCRRKGWI